MAIKSNLRGFVNPDSPTGNQDSVYPVSEDTLLLHDQMKPYCKGLVLDVGSGSGFIAIEASKLSEAVIAVDINPEAVAAGRQASKAAGRQNCFFLQSDMFGFMKKLTDTSKNSSVLDYNSRGARDAIFRYKGFELITFNAPYLPADLRFPDTALDGGKKGYELLMRFIADMPSYLNENGNSICVFSSRSGAGPHGAKLRNFALTKRLESEIVAAKKVFFEEIFCMRLWKK